MKIKLKRLSTRDLFKINVVYIFIFLNIWDFVISREIFTAMIFGLMLFGPIAVLWLWNKLRAIVLITFISMFEFLVLSTFVLEGFQLSGAENSVKTVFWVPYLIMTIVNGFWGLKIYSDLKEKRKIV